tara:strand:+ start:93 stop:824 length:732 start_codon:yes stop_codon:yes gene_type:complete
MTVTALIPARLHSTRLEKKLLKDLKGIPLIVRTYQTVNSTKLFDEVKVVTDSDEIIDVLEKYKILYYKSTKDHKTGTDRIAEFAHDMKSDIIINIQGDEPFVEKEDLNKIISVFESDKNKKINVVSLMIKLYKPEDINNPNNVKVVVDTNNDSIFFSRNPIPFVRKEYKQNFYKHVGVYAFRNIYLKEFSKYKQTPLEKTEMIEALRIIENGKKIRMIEIYREHVSIDTLEDLERAKSILKGQ